MDDDDDSGQGQEEEADPTEEAPDSPDAPDAPDAPDPDAPDAPEAPPDAPDAPGSLEATELGASPDALGLDPIDVNAALGYDTGLGVPGTDLASILENMGLAPNYMNDPLSSLLGQFGYGFDPSLFAPGVIDPATGQTLTYESVFGTAAPPGWDPMAPISQNTLTANDLFAAPPGPNVIDVPTVAANPDVVGRGSEFWSGYPYEVPSIIASGPTAPTTDPIANSLGTLTPSEIDLVAANATNPATLGTPGEITGTPGLFDPNISPGATALTGTGPTYGIDINAGLLPGSTAGLFDPNSFFGNVIGYDPNPGSLLADPTTLMGPDATINAGTLAGAASPSTFPGYSEPFATPTTTGTPTGVASPSTFPGYSEPFAAPTALASATPGTPTTTPGGPTIDTGTTPAGTPTGTGGEDFEARYRALLAQFNLFDPSIAATPDIALRNLVATGGGGARAGGVI